MKSINLRQNWSAKQIVDIVFNISNNEIEHFKGNRHTIDGSNKVAHLMKIHNCSNLTIRNVTFMNGDTRVIQKIPRQSLIFQKNKGSIFEIIDGGAVIITGNSNVVFENCNFVSNRSIMCGGAISNQSSGTVTIRKCVFKNNIAGHTGSAIDNLTAGSNIEINGCRFSGNSSNEWHKTGSPHGQISIFSKTKASIINTYFEGASIPFDFYKDSIVNLSGNSYKGYNNWTEEVTQRYKQTMYDQINVLGHLYWVIPKTIGKVYYRVNK